MEFLEFPKTHRLFREMIVTEKIDGAHATVGVDELGQVWAGSRAGWIAPEKDEKGFRAWTIEHAEELRQLGPGLHRGEWWGRGFPRNYGLVERRFSLFNVQRFVLHGDTPRRLSAETEEPRFQQVLPPCCGLVPVLRRCMFDTQEIARSIQYLAEFGSAAAPGFMDPEGIVVFHTAANIAFKQTLRGDGPKSSP